MHNRAKINNLLSNHIICASVRVSDLFSAPKLTRDVLEVAIRNEFVGENSLEDNQIESLLDEIIKLLSTDCTDAPVLSNSDNVTTIKLGDITVNLPQKIFKMWRGLGNDEIIRRALYNSFDDYLMLYEPAATHLVVDMPLEYMIDTYTVYENTIQNVNVGPGSKVLVYLQSKFIIMYYINIMVPKLCAGGAEVILLHDCAFLSQIAAASPRFVRAECATIKFIDAKDIFVDKLYNREYFA